MRLPLAILGALPLLLCTVDAVHAKPEEKVISGQIDNRSMLDRFSSNPNYDLTYHDQSIKNYGTTKTVSGSQNGDIKAFNFMNVFRTRDYATNTFNTSSGYWAGNFKFKTSEANLDSHSSLTSIIRIFKTKAADTKTDRAATETYQTHQDLLTNEKSNAVIRGKIQGRLDKQGATYLQGEDPIKQGDMHVMSIDEVRDLLNKTK